jgi:Uncharacterised nucleotidyltransferase
VAESWQGQARSPTRRARDAMLALHRPIPILMRPTAGRNQRRGKASSDAEAQPRGEVARIPLFPPMGRAAERALFHGIDGAPPGASPEDWARDLHLIVHHRLAGLALAAVAADGTKLDQRTEELLTQARETDVVRSMAAEVAAPAAIARLREADVSSVVTKGPGIADTYPQPALRPFRDIDILVSRERFPRARRGLESLGFHSLPDRERPRAYFDLQCREAVNLFRDDGTSIDLHHHIPPWIWGRRLHFQDIRHRAQMFQLPAGTIPVADRLHNLVIACLHLISDGGRPGQTLLIWRDLVSLAHATDPRDGAEEARRVGLDWCLSFVLRALPDFARPPELLHHLGGARPDPAEGFRLRHLLPPAVGSRHVVGQAFRLPFPNAVSFLAGYLVPSRAFLKGRYGSPNAYRRWWGDAFGRLREAQTLP